MYKRIFGIAGIAGAFLLLVAIAVAALLESEFLPLNGFINELGLYSGGYFAIAPALFFNLAFIVFGLVFGAMFVYSGLCELTVPAAMLGFLGALTGVLAAAQGIFTINVSNYHYVVSTAFHCAVFVLAAAYVAFALRGLTRKSLPTLIVAGLAGLLSAAYASFILSGGMSRYLVEVASLEARSGVVPFALIGWVSAALVLAFSVLYAVELIVQKNDEPEAAL